MLLMTVELESCQWIVIGLKFRMRLCLNSQSSSKIITTSLLAKIRDICTLSKAPNESVICIHTQKLK